MLRRLRPYQERGKYDIFKAWEHDDVLFFQLATGGGKTVIFTDVIMQYLIWGKRVLMVAHREELITQAWKTLFDANVYAGVIQAKVSHITHYGKTYGVCNHTLPAQVCSIQTVARRQQLPHADLIVIDEGHHTNEDNSYGKLLQRYPNAKVLIVSATPYRLSGEGFEKIIPGKITKLIINSTYHNLIEDGWLVPYRFFIPNMPELDEREVGSDGDYKTSYTHEKMKMAPIVESYLSDAKGKQGLTFAVNVAHSIEIVQKYLVEGVPAEHVDANTSDDERTRIITDFRAGLVKVVSNCDIFTEGTDFPGCEFVQLARPTKSLSKYLQMVGRGTRPEAGLVDRFNTAAERREAIAKSSKPDLIILDNAGCAARHMLPDHPHDWHRYFRGTKWEKKEKKKPIEDELEMLVYVCEDAQGKLFRTHNVKEIEGLRLIEVTPEKKRQMLNVTAIKEFDRLHHTWTSQYTCKNPGYKALEKYILFCEQRGILMVSEIWDYLAKKLVGEPTSKKNQLNKNRLQNSAAYPQHQFAAAIAAIDRDGVTEAWLIEQKDKYFRKYKTDLINNQYQMRTS